MEMTGTNNYAMKSKENKFDDIYDVVKLIPAGKVSSYGAIAAYLGGKRGARMVGWAMNASHGDSTIPAHRVVNRNGLLTGKMFFESPDAMQNKLESEGLKIIKDQIQDFQTHFWDPSKELL